MDPSLRTFSMLSTFSSLHPRICTFYTTHPAVDFETVNLFIVDMLETLFDRVTPNEDDMKRTSIPSQLLKLMTDQHRSIADLTSSVSDLKQSVSSFHTDAIRNCMDQLLNVRKEYIDDLKSIIHSHTTDQLRPLLEKNTHDLIDKTTSMIHDAVPRGQTQWFQQIQESIQYFHKSISDDTRQLIKHMDNAEHHHNIKDFIASFEQKSTQWLVQPLREIIASSEERITTSTSSSAQIVQELSEFLHQYKTNDVTASATAATANASPSNPAQQIHLLLNQIYPTSEVARVSRPLGQSASAAAFILKRPDRTSRTLIEHKDIGENVGEADLHLFLQDVEHHGCHGIFLSARSGFTNKGNYQIEQHQGYFVIYIHCVEYNAEKIRVAMDVLDHLSVKWKEYGHATGNATVMHIDADMLEKINQEHQAFVTQKETVVQVLKDNHRKIIAQMEDLRLPVLDQYLSTKFVSTSHKPGLLCNMCKHYYANNLKALAAHKRGCARKQQVMFPANTLMVTAV